jgi:hypothetical protein
MKSIKLSLAIPLLLHLQGCNNAGKGIIRITSFGARGDGVTLNTGAIQEAIDKASLNGGTVIVPPGRYLTGSIFLKSNVSLELLKGAEITGSPSPDDYPFLKDTLKGNRDTLSRHLVIIYNAVNVTLKGEGTINGQGWNFWENPENPYQWIRAKPVRPDAMIMVSNSRNVAIKDINLVNPPNWTVNIHSSEKVYINGVVIDNNLRSPNSDGFDISGSREVIISDCNISTCDDAIVLNSVPGDVSNVTINNCLIRTLCAAVKIGWPGDRNNIRDVTVSNCNILSSNRGLAIYQSYGITENISVSNMIFNSNTPVVFTRPIHIDLRKYRDTTMHTGVIRNVCISNFTATTQGRILVTAEKGSWIENLTLRGITMMYPYIEDPGLYARHPSSDQASNRNPEARVARAAIVTENVKNLLISDIHVTWPSDPVPPEWRIETKIENGSMKLHHPDYTTPRPVEFSVLWGRGLDNPLVDLSLASSSVPGLPKTDIR